MVPVTPLVSEFLVEAGLGDEDTLAPSRAVGLSFGSGDSVIGINPSDDSLGSVAQLLEMTYEVITRWEIPTQNCVLSHVSTQMEAMRKGAPVGLVFQSLAGSRRSSS